VRESERDGEGVMEGEGEGERRYLEEAGRKEGCR
jgi:hypothetical protein